MSTIAATYAAVCANKPEAAVEGLFNASDTSWNECWFHPLVNGKMHWRVAEALIVSHWLTLLPVETALTHDSAGEWVIFDLDSKPTDPGHKTPFDALAAYLLGGGE